METEREAWHLAKKKKSSTNRQPSGAAGRSRAKARAEALAAAGQLELKFSVRVEDADPLVASGDLSETALLTRRPEPISNLPCIT